MGQQFEGERKGLKVEDKGRRNAFKRKGMGSRDSFNMKGSVQRLEEWYGQSRIGVSKLPGGCTNYQASCLCRAET